MNDDDAEVCPRCGAGFHCGANDAAPCACATIALSAETLAELRASYRNCLCLRCLEELATDQKKSRPGLKTGRL